MNLCPIDFEYNSSKEKKLNLVCCSLKWKGEKESIWLHQTLGNYKILARRLEELNKQGAVFLAWNVVAEARSFLGLDLAPLKFKWIDLYLEYRHIANHNHNIMYGKQLKKGKVKFIKPPKPKWERTEEDEKEADDSKPEFNLGAGLYKLLGVKIDTKFKDATRDLIISNPEYFTTEEQDQIVEYCESDIDYLEPAYHAIIAEYKRLLGDKYLFTTLYKEMRNRSNYACRTAIMEELGYPINVEATRQFSKQVPNILLSCQREINKLFPHNPPFYKFKRKEGTYTLNQKAVREEIKRWLKDNPRNRWMLTDGGKSGKKDLSLSLKAFTRHFNYTHTYPKNNYFAQMVRFLKLKQNLNGFMPGGKTNFWDYVGSDGMVRPYMGIYTAQSSRSQPKASSFIPLKSAWMRVLIEPPKGKAMYSIDWASQEYLIAALISGDKKMIKAYESGDVYLAYAIDAKVVPPNATKKTHKTERDMMKPVILGQQYDLTEFGLAKQLTEAGHPHTPEQAKKWITKHQMLYSTLWKFKAKVQRDYKINKKLKLPDGWYLWGDNPNFRSVGNVPSQGMAACIMRKAVELAQDRGLDITYTLHDALYGMADTGLVLEHIKILAECMDEAFRFYFPDVLKEKATCRLDGDIWGQDLEEIGYGETKISFNTMIGKQEIPIKVQKKYIDERGADEYKFFKKYLEPTNEQEYETMEF